MYTIFTIPKPFTNPHTKIIQNNAIGSWKNLSKSNQIILVGNDTGVKKAAANHKAQHISQVKTSPQGTPILSSAFSLVRKVAQNPYLIYVNTDILFTKDLTKIYKYLPKKRFLVVGQRWDLDVSKPINYSNPNWDKSLKNSAQKKGSLHPPAGSDYFIFPKNCFQDLPDFVVGRVGWDNWMIHSALKQDFDVIDASQVNTIIHQNHDYRHIVKLASDRIKIPEAKHNLKLAQGIADEFTLKDANSFLTSQGLVKKNRLIGKTTFFIRKIIRPLRHRVAKIYHHYRQ